MDPAQRNDPDASAVDTPAARKYRLFKRLLDRNRDALRALADLEQAYYGGRVTGVSGLRTGYDRLARSAHELVLDLQELSEGGHAGLENVLYSIGRDVAPLLRGPAPPAGDLVVPLKSVTPEASGSRRERARAPHRGRALHRLRRLTVDGRGGVPDDSTAHPGSTGA